MSWVSERLSEIRARLASVRAWLASWIAQGWHWLIAPGEPLTWAALRAKLTLTTLPLPKTNGGRLAVLVGVGVLLLLALLWYASGQPDDKGVVTYSHASLINPILGGLGALFLIYAAIRQAQIAADRHAAQTNADLQRRTTETFSKAVEQLGNERVEVRVGGIYTLERLAGETLTGPAEEGSGPDLYWTVMETLTAFVRERARWKEPEPSAPEMAAQSDPWQSGSQSDQARQQRQRPTPATDIAAILAVLRRRPAAGREREKLRDWRLDLRMTDLRGAVLDGAHLERAVLGGAHLERANLGGAHLERANLGGAHLERAFLDEAHLEGASLIEAHLEGAHLIEAHLEGAILGGAHLERAVLREAHLAGAFLREAHLTGANLIEAHLEGADLRGAHLERAFLHAAHLAGADFREAQLDGADLSVASGDAKTRLPVGIERPADWPPYAP